MIRILTDTGSDITAGQALEMNIDLIPLVTSFDDEVCPMDTEADYDRFYEKLKASKNLPTTSRPSPEHYLQVFEAAKRAGDDALVLTLSSGLSSTIESAMIAREMCRYDRIAIVDTEQAVMSQRILVEHAVKLRDQGCSLEEIAASVQELRSRVVVYGVIGSLVYLRKGGRIPPALGVLGDALGIKPVITIADKVIKPLGKVRGMQSGIIMLYKEIDRRGIDFRYPVCFGYTSDRGMGEDFMKAAMEKYAIREAKLAQVSGIIGTHLGTDSVGVAFVAKE